MADLSDSANWFEVDGSNNRPPPNGWPEGMMPSGVNDTARADKGALKRFWDKLNPVQTVTPVLVGGITNTWTFTTSNTAYPSAYVNGEVYCFKAGAAAAGGDQFQVNALGAKPIQKRVGAAWAALVPGDIQIGTAPHVIYDGSLAAGAGAFILLNPYIAAVNDGAGGTALGGSLTVGGDIHAAGSAYLGGEYLFFNGNTNSAAGPLIYSDSGVQVFRGGGSFYFENNAGTPLVTINNAGDLGQLGSYIYLFNSSGVVSGAGGPLIYGDGSYFVVKPGGGNGGFIVQDYNGNSRFLVSGDGHLANNGFSFAFCGGGYNQLYDAAGNVSVFLGSGINYYRNTSHQFQTISGGATQMSLDGGGNATIAGGLLVSGGNATIAGGLLVNGNLAGGVAVHAPAGALQSDVSGTALYLPNGDISAQNIVLAGSSAGGAGSNLAILCNNGAVQVSRAGTAFYAPNGNVVCVSLTQSSDIRIKRDIKDYDKGLQAVLALRPVTYRFNGKGGTRDDGKERVGLIADEVLPVMPEMVGTLDRDDGGLTGIKTLEPTALVYILINAVRDLAARLATLEAR